MDFLRPFLSAVEKPLRRFRKDQGPTLRVGVFRASRWGWEKTTGLHLRRRIRRATVIDR